MTSAALPLRRATTSRVAVAAQLSLLVIVAAVVQLALALVHPSPWIVPDEIIYSELAKSVAAGHLPAVREATSLGYGLVYPVLIAPAWALFADVSSTYAAARVIGAIVMALTALPAYFLARRFVSHPSALIVATFSVFVPSMLYSATILTEVALYPVTALALLATTVALERPTLRNQAFVLGAVALAVATKSLAFVMLPAYAGGILMMAALWRRGGSPARSYLRSFLPTWAVFAAGAVALGLLAATGGASRLLGYNAGNLDYVSFSAIPRWFVLHVAELDLYVAAAPFLASILICMRAFRRRGDAEARLFASVAIPAVTLLLLAIAGFASDTQPRRLGYGWGSPDARLHERNMFALVPLLLVGLALWFERPEPLRGRRFRVAAAVTVLLPALLPLSKLRDNAEFQAMALLPWLRLDAVVLWPLGGVAFATVGVLALWRGRRRFVWGFVAVWFALVTVFVFGSTVSSSDWTRDAGLGRSGAPASWIDDAVGRDSQVAVVWWEKSGAEYARLAPRHRVVWINEFFNRSVGPVYSVGAAMPYSRLPVVAARIRRDGVLVDAAGRPLRARYVLTCGVELDASLVERRPGTQTTLYRVGRGPVRVTRRGLCPV
jgi:Dolichyl-phosphate-mannose-protein mannosyltransferase